MHWSDEGRIQVSRSFAIGAVAVIIALALAAMFLIGMVVSGEGDIDSGSGIPPTPTVLAGELDEDNGDVVGSPQQASKSSYSTCLARTWRALNLDARETEFKPWEDRTTTKSVWPIIELRHVDYIADHCHSLAPEPPSASSATCIPSSPSEKQCSKRKSSLTTSIIPITVLLEPISHQCD